MPINPLQLPGPLVVPQVDFTPLARIGQMIGEQRVQEREAAALGDYARSLSGQPQGQPQPQQPQPIGQPAAAAPPGGQLPRGLRNNNPGNIEDGPLARSLPGYAGTDGRFARFDTPDNGLNAMDALLTSYGRRGLKTVRDVINRWAPSSDGNPVDAYARYAGNGNPDAPVDLSNPEQRRALALRMAQFENGMATPMPAPQQPAEQRGMPAGEADRIDRLARSGPEGRKLAAALLSKYIGKQEPIKLSEGDVLIDPNNYRTIAAGPPKTQRGQEPKIQTIKTEDGREFSVVFDPKTQSMRLPTQQEIAAARQNGDLPPELNPRVVRDQRSREFVENEQMAARNAAAAAEIKPLIDKASAAYQRAIQAGAIGQIVGSPAARLGAKYITGGEAENARQEYETALAAVQARITAAQNKGQGAVSDFERRLYALQFPNLQASNPQEQMEFLKQLQASTNQTIDAGKNNPLGRQPSVVTDRPGVGQPVRVNSPAEAARLPSGTRFIDPNGVERIRP